MRLIMFIDIQNWRILRGDSGFFEILLLPWHGLRSGQGRWEHKIWRRQIHAFLWKSKMLPRQQPVYKLHLIIWFSPKKTSRFNICLNICSRLFWRFSIKMEATVTWLENRWLLRIWVSLRLFCTWRITMNQLYSMHILMSW